MAQVTTLSPSALPMSARSFSPKPITLTFSFELCVRRSRDFALHVKRSRDFSLYVDRLSLATLKATFELGVE